MSVPKLVLDAKGSWAGTSKLNLPWLPPEEQISESNSTLRIECDDQDTFATITYTWHYEEKRHQGTILLCMDDTTKKVQIGWVDSWHQNSSVMHLAGPESSEGSFKTKGSFSAGDEVWGWTIELRTTDDKLALKMENVSPAGEADWAVDSTYTKI